MPRFEVTVTQRERARVDAAAATKCKCKCDAQLDPAASPQRRAQAEESRSSRASRPSVELSPLTEEPNV